MEGVMEKLMTIAELAEYLDIPINTIYGWRRDGIGPRGSRVGRHVRYQPADVAAWLKSNQPRDDVATWLESTAGHLRDRVSV
jgi:excisionase family DNA binding protein